MATRRAEGLKVVARARRIEWPVEQMTGGEYRITCPDGHRVQVHGSPSDVNHIATILRELNKHGFAEAEVAASEADLAEREAKLAADREANKRREAKAKQAATALARAAGPYGPAAVSLEQILEDHPAPLVYHRVLITPPMAKAVLEHNSHNRPIRSADVAEWSQVLRTHRWRYTHQGVAIDVEGRLQDGQHRLTAIAETGISAEMMVSVGMSPDNFAVIDTGRRRSAAAVLAMDGTVHSALTASATRLLYLYEVWGSSMLDHLSERVGNDVIAEVHAKLDPDQLLFAVRAAMRLRSEVGVGPSGPAAALYLISRRLPLTDPRPTAFAEALIHGVADPEDPVYVARRALTRQAAGVSRKLAAASVMALLVKAWNARMSGRKASHMVVRAGASMPAVVVPPDVPTLANASESRRIGETT
jgi:hypothetical protein